MTRPTTRLEQPEPVLTPIEWSFPAPPVERELLEVLPEQPTGKPPILFVHGLSHGAWCWREHWMPEAAANGWPTYAVSLRGHGGSAGGEHLDRTPLRHYVHDVLQAITELPEPPVLVGHSMGGLVVQHVLERYAARAGVLVAPVAASHGFGSFALLLRHRPRQVLRALAGRTIELDREMLFSDDLDEATAQRHIGRLGPEGALVQHQLVLPRRPRPSKAPLLVIGAGDDRLVPVIDVVRTARHYGTRAHVFRGMAHDMMLEPDWKAPLDLVLRWLEDAVGRHH